MSTTTNTARGPQTTADDDLAFAGISRLADLLASGHLTPRELTEFYLRRIDALNPTLGAFVSTRAEEALAEADSALERLRAGERGPLLGIRSRSRTTSISPVRSPRTARTRTPHRRRLTAR